MKLFAIFLFATHMVFELAFGASAILSGASSSQSAEQIAQQPIQLTIAFRFMGSALIALGVLAAVVLFGSGVGSPTARFVAIGFATFHGLGTLGSLWTAAPTFEVYAEPLALGAVTLHGLLAIGFLIFVAFQKPQLA